MNAWRLTSNIELHNTFQWCIFLFIYNIYLFAYISERFDCLLWCFVFFFFHFFLFIFHLWIQSYCMAMLFQFQITNSNIFPNRHSLKFKVNVWNIMILFHKLSLCKYNVSYLILVICLLIVSIFVWLDNRVHVYMCITYIFLRSKIHN